MIPHTPTLTTDDVDEAWSKLLDYYGTLENNAMPMRIYDLVLEAHPPREQRERHSYRGMQRQV